MKRRGHLRLIQQAIRNKWPVSLEGRMNALALVMEVLHDEFATDRESILACQTVVLMETTDIEDDEYNELFAEVKRLGQEINTLKGFEI